MKNYTTLSPTISKKNIVMPSVTRNGGIVFVNGYRRMQTLLQLAANTK